MMCQPLEHSTITLSMIRQIAAIIDSERKLKNRELLSTCGDLGVDCLEADPHICHEIGETALNYLIASRYGKHLLSSDDPRTACAEIIRPLQQSLPTQSWRSATQVAYQQFSTPAPIAYLATYLLNLTDRDTVLEPSCGTGGRVERTQNRFGFRHVDSALRRLVTGGRFAVILGEGGSPETVTGKRFWGSLKPDIRITRSTSLPGREYYRNGTTVGITLIFGHKCSVNEPENEIHNHQNFDSVEDAFETIKSE